MKLFELEGQERLAEKQRAEADKDIEEPSEVTVSSAELKPGERKVISDGTAGPVVEIIKRSVVEDSKPVHVSEEEQAEDTEDLSEAEETGE